MSKITSVKAREILDSRGYPTIEVEVKTEKGYIGISSVPAGNSIGSMEKLELRDNDSRYFGNGVLKAINNINKIISKNIIGIDSFHQKEIDNKLIELDNKHKLGSNSILAVSIACIKASSMESNKEVYEYLNPREKKIPKSLFTVISGNTHAKNNLDFEEFMIVPKKENFSESLRCASEIYHELKTILDNDNLSSLISFNGGYAPNLQNNESALNYIVKSIESSGYKPGKDVFIALNISATTLYNEQNKTYKIDNNFYTSNELLDYYLSLMKKYPIISIEGAFSENDIDGYKMISEKLGKEINIVGGDIFSTCKDKLQDGINNKICNSISIKPNQVGTFLETLETIILAKKNNYTCIMSSRFGETTDTFICDAAVALNIPFIKFGSVSSGMSKYNRLLKIEEELGEINEK